MVLGTEKKGPARASEALKMAPGMTMSPQGMKTGLGAQGEFAALLEHMDRLEGTLVEKFNGLLEPLN